MNVVTDTLDTQIVDLANVISIVLKDIIAKLSKANVHAKSTLLVTTVTFVPKSTTTSPIVCVSYLTDLFFS